MSNLYCVNLLGAYMRKFNLSSSIPILDSNEAQLLAETENSSSLHKIEDPTPNMQVQEIRKRLKSVPNHNCQLNHSRHVRKLKNSKRRARPRELGQEKNDMELIVSFDRAAIAKFHTQHSQSHDVISILPDHAINTKVADTDLALNKSTTSNVDEHMLMCINNDHSYCSSSLDSNNATSPLLNEDHTCSNTTSRESLSTLSSYEGSVVTHSSGGNGELSPLFSTPLTPHQLGSMTAHSSSSSSDLNVCDMKGNGSSEPLFEFDANIISMSRVLPKRIFDRTISILRCHSTGGNPPRLRRGPVPLPRSFSKRYSSLTELKTKAAKTKPLKNSTATSGRKGISLHRRPQSRHLRKSLSEHLKKQKMNDVETQPANARYPEMKARIPEMKLLCKDSDDCRYKKQLLKWKNEINERLNDENDCICVENEVDNTLPPHFKYVCSNIYREGVPDPDKLEMRDSLCGCDCTSHGCSCGPKSEYCCANLAGSKFAYTQEGRVQVPPGTPIYECNSKCTCPSNCRNRVVQLGKHVSLCVFMTRGKGWGVKTMQPIPANTFVCEYVGEVITKEEAERRGEMSDGAGLTYQFDLDIEDNNPAFTIDAADYGNISHFFNHSVSCA